MGSDPRERTGWALYEFNCPVDGCGMGRSIADHDRRDPATMFAPCPVHEDHMELVRKTALAPVSGVEGRPDPRALVCTCVEHGPPGAGTEFHYAACPRVLPKGLRSWAGLKGEG